MPGVKRYETLRRWAARGGIVAFFIMAFEVMIMISPFAFFFYSVFNPVLHWMGAHPALRWLTDFFLPHMILPPTAMLKGIRVLGSALFVVGALGFFLCAAQVYLGKLLRWGVAARGPYAVVRHPQYLALTLWGAGMAILWPRFLVLLSLSIMILLYWFLARDEEERMLSAHGEEYRRYMERTGMFLPKGVERLLPFPSPAPGNAVARLVLGIVAVPVVVLGVGFALREITLGSLSYQSGANVTLVSILPEDEAVSGRVLEAILTTRAGDSPFPFLSPGKSYLGYVMPPDYVMQGMIADTGEAFHLHQHHQTLALISDWVLHPFEHLRRSPMAVMARKHGVDPAVARRRHCPLGLGGPPSECDACPYRRVVFIEVQDHGGGRLAREAVFDLGVERLPVGFADIDAATGAVVKAKPVGRATAWRDVPTPAL